MDTTGTDVEHLIEALIEREGGYVNHPHDRGGPTSTKGRSMTIKPAWPMLALLLTACAAKPERPQPIAAVAEQRLCPPPAQPPERLVVPPRKVDFLSTTR